MGKIYNAACELLDRNVILRGGKTALYYYERKISYAEIHEQVNRFGNLLKELGVTPGERILIALPDCPEFVYAFLGSMKYGAWPVPVNPQLLEENFAFILNDTEAPVIFTARGSPTTKVRTGCLQHIIDVDEKNFEARIASASAALDPHPSRRDDIALILYTSGSTGKPKGVPHRHIDLPFTAEALGKQVLNILEEDICFSTSKLFFAYGLDNSLSIPFTAGAGAVLYPAKAAVPELFKVISHYRPSVFFGVPTLYNMMLKSRNEATAFESVRLCVSAGEALPAATYHAWKQLTGKEIVEGWGMTETISVVIANRPGAGRPGTCGNLIPSYEAKIVGDDGKPVPSGSPGHLFIRGESTAPFYWNRPDKTAETMLPGGWLRTGDICIENEGYFSFRGRSDDMFKVGACWVAPLPVEDVLREHPAVLDCAVTWRKLEGLMKPLAYVVLNPGFQEGMVLFRDLRTHVLQKLPEHMCPVQIDFCAELPRTDTGKIQRFRLREGK